MRIAFPQGRCFRFPRLNILKGCSGLGVGRDNSQALADRVQAIGDRNAPCHFCGQVESLPVHAGGKGSIPGLGGSHVSESKAAHVPQPLSLHARPRAPTCPDPRAPELTCPDP